MTVDSAAYVDREGHPQLRTSIVAFIDILGFSQASTSSQQPVDSQRVLDKIVDAIEDSRRFVRTSFGEDEVANPSHWAIKYFSDNLAIGYPFDPSSADATAAIGFILRCVQRYQLRMAVNGYFLRGALSQGLLCLTDEIIFGPALVECYQLESKTSIVPRVIVTEPLRDLIWRQLGAESLRRDSRVRDVICRDIDGWWFVNYLHAAREAHGINWEFVERHKQSILESLSVTTRHEVLPKFGWACRYHNVFCHWNRNEPGYSDRLRIDRADEHSTINRFSDVTDVAH